MSSPMRAHAAPRGTARTAGQVLVASSVAVAALVSSAPAPASPVRTSVATVTERVPLQVGSYNIRAGVSTATFSNGVDAVRRLVDVAGLQEVNSHPKEGVLASLRSSGWNYYRPKPGEQSPVIWRSDRFRFVSGRAARIAVPRYIGNEVPARGRYTHPGYATVVHLEDLRTGAPVSVVNVHLTPGAVVSGKPVADRPRLFKAFRRSVVNLGRLARHEKAYGTVFVLGDFNVGFVADKRTRRPNLPYMTLRRIGHRSMWGTERPGRGSHIDSPALIDQVYTGRRATNASVRFGIRYSDHFPVVATYQMPVGG